MADYATACKYDEIETIGRGRFGIVKKVERRMDQREFACKVITVVQSPHDPSINDAKHEYEVLRALHHPNIVEYVDFERTDQEAKIYMELCRGGNLKDWIRERSKEPDSYLPEHALWNIILQLTSALTYCHFGWNPTGGEMDSSMAPNFRTVLHRDLKPANVLISSTDGPLVVKLGDFGLAKFMDLEHTLSTFAGTRPYLAPEIVDNEATGRVKWTKHSDVYSLGCIVYEICTLDLLLNSMKADFQRIPAVYSDSVRGFIARCLSREPSHRPDARELFQWASRCCGSRATTPGEMVESLTANPSTIGLLDQQLFEGVRSHSEFSHRPIVHVQISNQQTFWIDSRPFAKSLGKTFAWPIKQNGGMQALNQPSDKNEALAARQHGVVTLLQLGGFDPSNPSFSIEAAFSWAIRHGLWNVVRLLMGQGPSLESKVWFRDQRGHRIDRLTQNSFEAYNKLIGVISSLGIRHVDGEQALDLLMTPIHHATLQRNRGVLDLLINAGADINAAAIFNTTPRLKMSALMIAAIVGDGWIIRKLLDAGADPSQTFGADVLSPLILAVKMGLSESIIKLLIERGAGARLAANGMPISLNAIFWTGEEAIKAILLDCVDTSPENARAKDLELPLQRLLSDAAFSKHHTILRKLLDRGIAREFPGFRGQSPFLLAAANGDLEVMKLLLDKGVNTKVTDEDGCTALHLMAESSADDETKEQAVELLVKAGADVNARDKRQCTPLDYSVWQSSPSNEKMTEILLKHGADVHALDDEGSTSLMHASIQGSVGVMKMLLQAGVDVTVRNKDGCTALDFAAAADSDHEARFKLLQEHGAEIAALTDMTETVVHNAVEHCTVDAVEELFKLYPAAADSAHNRANDNMNALDIAAANGKREHLEFLLQKMTDLDMDSKSWVLYYAIDGGNAACVGLVISTFTDLASRAFKVPKPKGEGHPTITTPLHEASSRIPEVALLIMEHVADVTALNDLGWPALHDAVATDNVSVVRELLQRGKETMSWTSKVYHNFETGQIENDQPPWMLTAIHIAAARGATEALEALLAAGANINEPTHDEHGFTPLHIALSCHQAAAFHLLVSKGADHDNAPKQSQTTPLLLALNRGFEALAAELIYLGAQTTWTTPDGSTITALNIAAVKGFVRVTGALLGKLDDSRHAQSVPRIEITPPNDAPRDDSSKAEGLDDSTCDEKGSLVMVESLMESSSAMIPADFDQTVAAAVTHKNLNLLQRLADFWDSQTKRRYGKTAVQRSNSEPNTIRSGRDELARALRQAANQGLTDYIRPLMGICGWTLEFEGSDGILPIHAAALNGHGEFVRQLLSETNADVDQKTSDGTQRTALHIAAEDGFIDIVKTLLSHGAAVDRGDEDDWSALHFAASAGELEIVNVLIQRKADLNKKSNEGNSPLSLAAENGHLTVVEALVEAGAIVDEVTNHDGWTALFHAASEHDVDVVEALLEAGANPNQRCNDGSTPLLESLSTDEESEDEEVILETVKMLLQHGTDIEACDDEDWNALRAAACHGWQSIVKALLEHKADRHARDKDGDDALQIAALFGFREIAEILLEQGADISGMNNDGKTPLHTAALKGYDSVAELLIQKGAKLDAVQPETGSTPMHLAAEMDQVAVMQVLHFYGADIGSANKEQMTPLLLAIEAGHIEAATFLIQQKVDINLAAANAEKTALHLAIDQQNEHLMEILLQNGADPNAYPPTVNNGKKSGTCTKFRNPLSYCVNNGWLDGIQLLLKHNADVNSNWLEGGTALHIASTYSRQGAARLLLENGARTDIWDGRRAPLHSAAAAGDKDVLEALLDKSRDLKKRYGYWNLLRR
ncbi:hypothetical protein CEP54_004070 [Fusarium duplospermum]|uniref:Protein kinase domain-containing protein n=1 Tax=Fusarium duplospermum TaxID=1325734 RepID=A0A428QKL6_9HYPO|nr:hypothetical protein CEP54_004070 [Fusarium duplospermum]